MYQTDCAICEVNDSVRGMTVVRSFAIDPEAAKRLWAVSEEMVGQSFPV